MARQRSIFEEVGAEKRAAPDPAPAGPSPREQRERWRAAAVRWLIVLFALVLVMITVGGLTRLTDSGLSITEWRPVTGALPPMSAADWDAEFALYREIPEFRLQNSAMTLAEFKSIYWWEWGHRQLGRLIGLVWAAGFAWFALRHRVPRGWVQRFLGLGLLGGLQGAIGWWMVSSGLSGDRLDVAPYRLAVHLTLAFSILGLIGWYAMQLRRGEMDLFQARRQREAKLARLAGILVAMIMVQVVLGALVAGTDSGAAYPEWPLMAGQVFPPDAFALTPGWRNWFENLGLVQFNHRIWAYLILAKAAFVWWRARGSGRIAVRRAFDWVAVLVFGQVALGIATVEVAAAWPAAIAHQTLAVIVLVTVIRARFLSLYPPDQKIARGR